MTCAELHELAPELAFGTLTGDERGRALAHLEHCHTCQDVVDDLTGVADQLVTLSPAIEPPLGFESRVIERLGEGRRSGSGRAGGFSRRTVAAVAAAALVVGVAGGLAVSRTVGHRSAPARDGVRVAVAYGPGRQPLCQVFAHPGHPSLIVVNVDNPGEAGTYAVSVVTASRTVPLGAIQITGGRGSLGAVADIDLAEARAVQVMEADGRVLYDAVFQ
ncbi:MAG: hypothetical protein QOG64_1915 [Acidimicrobiaceae bacterium]|nr:hypothetical protein [Acidimicrobiaceae bacterium]